MCLSAHFLNHVFVDTGGSMGYLGPRPPKTQRGLFAPAPKQWSIGVNFFTGLDFFSDISVGTSHWRYQIVYFGVYLGLKFKKKFFEIPKSSRKWMLTHPGSIQTHIL